MRVVNVAAMCKEGWQRIVSEGLREIFRAQRCNVRVGEPSCNRSARACHRSLVLTAFPAYSGQVRHKKRVFFWVTRDTARVSPIEFMRLPHTMIYKFAATS